MNELDAPATKRDLLELATQRDLLALRDDLRHEIEKLGVKIEASGAGSAHVARLAFGVLAVGILAIIATAVGVILWG